MSCVDPSKIEIRMTKPFRNDMQVKTLGHEIIGVRVPKNVWRKVFNLKALANRLAQVPTLLRGQARLLLRNKNIGMILIPS